jgi:hypothetical protein
MRSAGLMHDRGSGIVLQLDAMALLEGFKLATCTEISVESREQQYLNKDGSVYSSAPSQPTLAIMRQRYDPLSMRTSIFNKQCDSFV